MIPLSCKKVGVHPCPARIFFLRSLPPFPPFPMPEQFLPFAIVIVSALLGFILNYSPRKAQEEEVEAD